MTDHARRPLADVDPLLGAALVEHCKTQAAVHVSALAYLLQRLAKTGAATPQDLQLLAALERWAEGELV